MHGYTFDILGRQTRDTVTTTGSGVDGHVRRIDTAYDTGGRPYLITSYGTTAGGSLRNQVKRAFNGLGQMITEWQAVSGAVNEGTTPKMQYTYTEMEEGANHSRLKSVWQMCPEGKYYEPWYDAIGRVGSIGVMNGPDEIYEYLGLGTVVKRYPWRDNVVPPNDNHVEWTLVKREGVASHGK